MEKKNEYLIVPIGHMAHTEAHRCVYSFTHTQATHSTHIQPPAAWGGEGGSARRHTVGSAGGSRPGVQLGWGSAQLRLIPVLESRPEPGQAGGKCKASFAGKEGGIHASCSDAGVGGGRAFPAPRACSVSLGRRGRNEGRRENNDDDNDNNKGR